MNLTYREKDGLQALLGTAKSAASLVPGLGQAIAGYEAYQQSAFKRQVESAIKELTAKVEDLKDFFEEPWFKSEEGQKFSRKVFDCAFDAQIEDKQELFVNTLINGVQNQNLSILEKLKFVDILRHLSLASLIVLAEIHKMFIGQVRGPGRDPDPIKGFPHVDPTTIVEKLSDKYDPYLVTSSISEMESQGMFSRTGAWRKDPDGRYKPSGGFATEMCYTDFAARFVEFITLESVRRIE